MFSNYNNEVELVINLSDLLRNIQEPVPMQTLPLFHSTRRSALPKMLLTGHIEAQEADEYFQEFLVFFFYGRARYIPEDELEDEFDPTDPPIVLVYDMEQLEIFPKRFVAFDSGGYGRLNIPLPLHEFAISMLTQGEELKKFIQRIYSENSNYLNKKITIDHHDYPLCSALEKLAALYNRLRERTSKPFGEQAYTVEIHYERKVPLAPVAVILPASMVSTPSGRQQVLAAFRFTEKQFEERVHGYDEMGETKFRMYSNILDIANSIVQKMDRNI